MVWSFAINDPLVVVTLSSKKGQFVASSPKAAILAFSNFNLARFPLFPVYLSPFSRSHLTLPSRHGNGMPLTEDPPPQVEPIFVLPQDILYMPEIYKLDSDLFLARNENHAIEMVAIHASSAMRLGAGEYQRVWSEEGKILRVLRNLKTVLILERAHMGDEMQFRHRGGYHLSLLDVKQQPDTSSTGESITFRLIGLSPPMDSQRYGMRLMK